MEWKEVRLGDVCEAIQTGPFGSQLHQSDYVEVGIPCIMPKNIGAHLDINSEDIAKVKPEDVERLRRHKVALGNIIYSRRGDIEKCAYITKEQEGWLCGTGCLKVCIDEEKADSKFIAYYLSLHESKSWLVGNAVGTTMLNLNTGILTELPINLPPLSTQRRISSVLSSLDRKIELNNKINATLEEMAQALFRSWFVDFEPFKNGNFIDSEIGKIPEGWRVGTLTQIASYLNGLAMQKFPPASLEESLPVLKIKELGQGRTDSNSDRCSAGIKPDYIIEDGDVIFSWSGTLLVDIWCGGRCGLNQHLFKVSSKEYPKWFYFFWTKHHLDKFIRIAKDKAVTMGHIKRGELDASEVLIPDDEAFASMDAKMAPLLKQRVALMIENRTLSHLRDTLLPRLMSGEIEV